MKQFGLKRLLLSLIAGLVGVQSDKNRRLDFAANSIWPFIIGGIITTLLFVGLLVLWVSWLVT